MALREVTLGIKTEYSDNPTGEWDDSDRYMVTSVDAVDDAEAEAKARAFWSENPGYESGYQVVKIVPVS